MPTNDAHRLLARNHDAHVTPFAQPEQTCGGWIDLWLRAAMHSKEPQFFIAKRFTPVELPVEGGGTTVRQVPQPALIDKAWKLSHQFSSDRRGEQTYITRGGPQKKSRETPKPRGRHVQGFVSQSIGPGLVPPSPAEAEATSILPPAILNLARCFHDSSTRRGLLRLSVALAGGEAYHAIGVDFMTHPPKVRYFDPLIGEFLFPDLKRFVAWWAACYAERDTTLSAGGRASAFDHFGTQFFGELFEDLPG